MEPYYDIEKWDQAGAAGSLSTTLDDYTKFYTALIQGKGLTKASFNEMIKPQIRIRSKQQFGPNALVNTTENDTIEFSYGLGVGVINTPLRKRFF